RPEWSSFCEEARRTKKRERRAEKLPKIKKQKIIIFFYKKGGCLAHRRFCFYEKNSLEQLIKNRLKRIIWSF
ncbi:MAG: hypothetical protein RR411_11055, partial [Chryseobacterium sp.]